MSLTYGYCQNMMIGSLLLSIGCQKATNIDQVKKLKGDKRAIILRVWLTVSGAAGVQQWLLIPRFPFNPSSKCMPFLVSAQGKMENMLYAEELVREFLVFRGFTNTHQAFVKELGTDIGKGFQVDKILDLIFSIYVPKFQAENLIELLRFFKQCFSSHETELISIISDLDVSIIRYYIIHAIQAGRKDKVIELFDIHGSELLQKNQEWASWFGGSSLSYLSY
ncbi:WD repeat-containing protein 91 [Datura stramonium]|uniref:WD repeat-containing protein 91 n=1 Tax=Datura stramonium TaxID=4076 RepID=A0ABS8T1S2_DATST|nr:WD repeat-containing protein 91 [Datura stramonium]